MAQRQGVPAAGADLTTLQSSVDALTDQSRAATRRFSSDVMAQIEITSTPTDVSLPSVVVPSNYVPATATVRRVYCAMSYRKSSEDSASPNALAGAQDIQIRDDSPSAWVDAINLADNSLAHAADGADGGFVVMGDNDVKATVDGEDTYNFQIDEAVVDGDSIFLDDVQMHIFVEFD